MDALIDRPTLTPPDSPLSMPVQEFDGWNRPARLPPAAGTTISRVFVVSLTFLLSSYAIWEMHRVIGQGTGTTLQYVLLVLFGLTFVWIAFAAANAFLGFLVTAARPEKLPRDLELTTRTAVTV